MEVAAEVVEAVRAACIGLPEVVEESAWVGTRWVVRSKTFAHVLAVEDAWPPAYAKASGSDGPATLLMFRSSGPELDALRSGGAPFFGPPWRPDEVGMFVTDDTDWVEVAELVRDSYCCQAPRALAAQVERPPVGD